MTTKGKGEARNQGNRQREIVVVVIAKNWQKWLIKHQAFWADGFPILAVMKPFPVRP